MLISELQFKLLKTYLGYFYKQTFIGYFTVHASSEFHGRSLICFLTVSQSIIRFLTISQSIELLLSKRVGDRPRVSDDAFFKLVFSSTSINVIFLVISYLLVKKSSKYFGLKDLRFIFIYRALLFRRLLVETASTIQPFSIRFPPFISLINYIQN